MITGFRRGESHVGGPAEMVMCANAKNNHPEARVKQKISGTVSSLDLSQESAESRVVYCISAVTRQH